MGTLKLLKNLDIYVSPFLEGRKEMEIPLVKLFQKLPHLEHLCMRHIFLLVRNIFYDNIVFIHLFDARDD